MPCAKHREPRCVSYGVKLHSNPLDHSLRISPPQPSAPAQQHICKLTPLCCLPKPLNEYSDAELNERDLYQMINWLHDEANIATANAVKYANMFHADGIMSHKKLSKHIQKNIRYLKELNIVEDDIEDIFEALGIILFGSIDEADNGRESPSIEIFDDSRDFTINYASSRHDNNVSLVNPMYNSSDQLLSNSGNPLALRKRTPTTSEMKYMLATRSTSREDCPSPRSNYRRRSRGGSHSQSQSRSNSLGGDPAVSSPSNANVTKTKVIIAKSSDHANHTKNAGNTSSPANSNNNNSNSNTNELQQLLKNNLYQKATTGGSNNSNNFVDPTSPADPATSHLLDSIPERSPPLSQQPAPASPSHSTASSFTFPPSSYNNNTNSSSSSSNGASLGGHALTHSHSHSNEKPPLVKRASPVPPPMHAISPIHTHPTHSNAHPTGSLAASQFSPIAMVLDDDHEPQTQPPGADEVSDYDDQVVAYSSSEEAAFTALAEVNNSEQPESRGEEVVLTAEASHKPLLPPLSTTTTSLEATNHHPNDHSNNNNTIHSSVSSKSYKHSYVPASTGSVALSRPSSEYSINSLSTTTSSGTAPGTGTGTGGSTGTASTTGTTEKKWKYKYETAGHQSHSYVPLPPSADVLSPDIVIKQAHQLSATAQQQGTTPGQLFRTFTRTGSIVGEDHHHHGQDTK